MVGCCGIGCDLGLLWYCGGCMFCSVGIGR